MFRMNAGMLVPDLRCLEGWTAVERTLLNKNSQGQILALAFRSESLNKSRCSL